VSQWPDLTPIDFALFTRGMPAASSGRQQPVVRRRDCRRADGRYMGAVTGNYTDRSGAFARRAATVASSVNPPEQRISVSAATAERAQGAAERHGAMMARSAATLVIRD